jgi:hypothetical protein
MSIAAATITIVHVCFIPRMIDLFNAGTRLIVLLAVPTA